MFGRVGEAGGGGKGEYNLQRGSLRIHRLLLGRGFSAVVGIRAWVVAGSGRRTCW